MEEYRDHLEMLVWQIMGKDNWNAVEQIPFFMDIFDRLPYKTRKIVEYRLEGYRVEEISEIIGLSVNAVRLRLSRTKKFICRNIVG